jgi:hypothetical protein
MPPPPPRERKPATPATPARGDAGGRGSPLARVRAWLDGPDSAASSRGAAYAPQLRDALSAVAEARGGAGWAAAVVDCCDRGVAAAREKGGTPEDRDAMGLSRFGLRWRTCSRVSANIAFGGQPRWRQSAVWHDDPHPRR